MLYFTKINLKHSETTLHSRIEKIQFLYFIEINFKLKICNSGTRLHSKIGKVHFTTYIFYKNQYKMLRNNEKYIIFYKNQFKSFRYNITLEDRKSTLQLIYFIKINLKQRKTLYTLQKST